MCRFKKGQKVYLISKDFNRYKVFIVHKVCDLSDERRSNIRYMVSAIPEDLYDADLKEAVLDALCKNFVFKEFDYLHGEECFYSVSLDSIKKYIDDVIAEQRKKIDKEEEKMTRFVLMKDRILSDYYDEKKPEQVDTVTIEDMFEYNETIRQDDMV